MSKLEELVDELCSQGVEFLALGEVCKIRKGKYLSKIDIGLGDVPIILYGELYTTYGNYITRVISSTSIDRVASVSIANRGDILLPISSTTKLAQIGKASVIEVEYPVYIGGDTIILSHNQNPGYLVHLLNSKWFESRKMNCVFGTTIMHLHPSKLASIKIPVPPLEVQQEIVRILDTFTTLEAELEAELEARKKQYDWYKKLLLLKPNIVTAKKLGEVAILKTGNKPKEILEFKDEFEYINAGTSNSGYAKSSNCSGDTVTTPSRGQGGIGFVGYQKNPFWLGPLCYQIKSKDTSVLLNRYLYHYLACFKEKILHFKNEGGTPSVNASDLAKISIDIPSIEDQNRTVSILDHFDILCNDLIIGLPAEIASRRKQYDYYRNKILNFREV